MKTVATVFALTLTAALVAGWGSGQRPSLAVDLDSSEASLPIARGLSLPAGHPPLEGGLLALPEGHPPLVDGGGALPEGHPRCPRGAEMPHAAPQLDFNVRSGADELVRT
jgi:Mrp family chromosome partitioning ATPase